MQRQLKITSPVVSFRLHFLKEFTVRNSSSASDRFRTSLHSVPENGVCFYIVAFSILGILKQHIVLMCKILVTFSELYVVCLVGVGFSMCKLIFKMTE